MSHERTAAAGHEVVDAVRHAKRSHAGHVLAALGLGSRAIVYGSLAVLTADLALTGRPRNTDQGSALADLGESGAGSVLLVALVFGVVFYTLWRWSEAIAGREDGSDRAGTRALAVLEGLTYLPFAYLAVIILAGHPARAHQGQQYRDASAQVLKSPLGVVTIVVVGVIVIIVGVVWFYQGVRQTFRDQFDFPRREPWVRRIVLALGTAGSVARGLIVIEAGVLVIYAAVTRDPEEAGGFDSALDALSRQTFGTALLLIAAVGFAAFALFAIAEAIWRER